MESFPISCQGIRVRFSVGYFRRGVRNVQLFDHDCFSLLVECYNFDYYFDFYFDYYFNCCFDYCSNQVVKQMNYYRNYRHKLSFDRILEMGTGKICANELERSSPRPQKRDLTVSS